MSAILDIQCVLGVNNKYMIKEMSVICVDTHAVHHWILNTQNQCRIIKVVKPIRGWDVIIINYL
jgi:hypothetical protein